MNRMIGVSLWALLLPLSLLCANGAYCSDAKVTSERKDAGDAAKYEAALGTFNEIIKANPNNAIAYTLRGLAYYKLGKPDKAIADFDKSIKLNPHYSHAYSSRGFIYVRENRHKEALADLNKAIELSPGNENAYYGRGLVYYITGQYDKSLSDYKKAIELKPNQEHYKDFVTFVKMKNPSDKNDTRSAIINLFKAETVM